jgi:hypothetical protein
MAEIETLTAGGVRLDAAADTALRAAAGLWLLTAVVGQWMFVYYIGA